MNRDELARLVGSGENSGVEFKRDDLRPERVGREIAGLLNLEGGHLLLGVEDDGTVTGLSRDRRRAEEWVMEAARTHVRPATIPYWETVEWRDGVVVGVVSLPADAPDKPYKAKRGSAWVTQVRAGTTTRDATDEEEMRLYQQSGRLQYDRKPVPGTSFADLDRRRLINYFRDVREQECPDETDEAAWTRLLVNTEIMVEGSGRSMASAAGLLLFGKSPNRFLPHAGVSAAAYCGTEKDYDARERATVRGPAVSLAFQRTDADGTSYPGQARTFSEGSEWMESGVIERTLEFVRRNVGLEAWIDAGGRRRERWEYPLEAVREAVVNAIAHRDYTITVSDIELSIYADRMEIVSPGRLPNTVTVAKMRAGYRATRNELVKEVLRDYRYVEATGLGVPRKIVRGMQEHNGTEPDLIEEEDRFTVQLWKRRPAVGA
ncbi:MAG: putative DNA binding domain-containing protein [Spirochaetaceae bacterium]|nr:putative DNA binding domain-containing protein [Spirochaetaceae bacterium]